MFRNLPPKIFSHTSLNALRKILYTSILSRTIEYFDDSAADQIAVF